MINRRLFLEVAAVAAMPAAGASQRIEGAQPAASLPGAVHTVIIDARYAQPRDAGARLSANGIAVRAIPDGDVTQIWLSDIGPAWRARQVTIAGFTARPALFCLEQLAFSCGLRVVFHAEHLVHRQGRTEHRLLRGAQTAGLSVRDLALAGWLWPARVAEALAMHPGSAGHERFGPSDAALSPTLPPDVQLLTSWIIAAA